jgi:DMSO/TMAO reductase YedYZ molybdopterin-dependent catalytic subunit
MAKIIERSLEELHGDDPERADAMVFGRRWAVSRRGLLGATSLGGFGAAVGAAIHYGDAMPAGLIPAALAQGAPAAAGSGKPSGPQVLNFPGKEKGLVVLGERPLVAETPEHLLDDETTPTAKFFIRNNGQIPEPPASPDTWKIVVDGEVNTPLELTLGELKSRFSPKTYRMVLECGGNGRSAFQPEARGNPWTNGGAGCAEWTGIPLADVLKAAGVKDSAKYTAHYGADPHLSGDTTKESISRGMRLPKAMDDHNLVVFAMNGEPLPNIHGGPVRLVVPGWPGSLSHKWLTRITLRDREHDGQGMTGTSYRVRTSRWCQGERRTRRISAFLKRCRCDRSRPRLRMARGCRPAPARWPFGVQPGPGTSLSRVSISPPISARPGVLRRSRRSATATTGTAGPRA